jgi:septal ring factor EnvC (AmiA/AmiB activator)
MSAQSLGQFEKNVSVSFGYVKKDLLMVNDSVSELHDKIQHLSLNQAMLLEKISELEHMASKKKEVKTTVAKKKVAVKKAKKVASKKTKTTSKKTSKTPRKVVTETVLYE